MSWLASTPTLNVQFVQRIVSLNSKLCDWYSEWIGGTAPTLCCWTRAVKKIGVPLKLARAAAGMVIRPQPFELRSEILGVDVALVADVQVVLHAAAEA